MGLYKNLKKALENPSDVSTLKLTVSKEVLPEELFTFTNLDTLYLQSKKLNQIDDRIAELKNLKILYIKSAELKEIPNSLICLPQLETLNLAECRIEKFVLEAPYQGKFHTLFLNKNHLESIPQNLEQLESLTTLNLSDNQLNTFDQKILNLFKLKKLSLDRNKIEKLPVDQVKKLKELQSLSLDGNPFSAEQKELIQNKLNYWFGEI